MTKFILVMSGFALGVKEFIMAKTWVKTDQ